MFLKLIFFKEPVQKIVFLIRGIDNFGGGGAETQLVNLAKGLSINGFDVTILCIFPIDERSREKLASSTIQLISLEKQGRWDSINVLSRLIQQLKMLQPDYLHSYLTDSNVISVLIKPFFPQTKIVWGIRHSNLGTSHPKASHDIQFAETELGLWQKGTYYLEQTLSQFADLIITNSQAGKQYHASKGYPANKIRVIPNGIDVDRFHPRSEQGLGLRREWPMPASTTIVIGIVGRIVPMKDHPNFLKMAALLCQTHTDIHFVCVGRTDNPSYTVYLHNLTETLGISHQVSWVGSYADMPAVYNALDILISASAYGEGFSNTIGEAMACGTPCVATDVGDSARIVGEQGMVVSPGEPEALHQAVLMLIQNLVAGNVNHDHIRQRIVEHFSVPQLIDNTEYTLLNLSNDSVF